jgi:hypothetical protein
MGGFEMYQTIIGNTPIEQVYSGRLADQAARLGGQRVFLIRGNALRHQAGEAAKLEFAL